jgi:hypothetical protein
MSRWTDAYSHGTLIDFDFLAHLKFCEEVQRICAEKGWQYDALPGDLTLLQKLVNGDWPDSDFLVVQPGQKVVATFDDRVIGVAELSS